MPQNNHIHTPPTCTDLTHKWAREDAPDNLQWLLSSILETYLSAAPLKISQTIFTGTLLGFRAGEEVGTELYTTPVFLHPASEVS